MLLKQVGVSIFIVVALMAVSCASDADDQAERLYFKQLRLKQKYSRKRARSDPDLEQTSLCEKKSKLVLEGLEYSPISSTAENYTQRQNAGLFGHLPIEILNLICSFLTAHEYGQVKSCCTYTYRIPFGNLWPNFAQNGRLFHTPGQDQWEDIVRSHYRVPPSIRHESYMPAHYFFYQVIDLSRATAQGSIEAAFYLCEFLKFRGHHYMRSALGDIIQRLEPFWWDKIDEIEDASDDLPGKHMMLGLMKRNHVIGGGPREAIEHFETAYEQGEVRALLEIGRLYEKKGGPGNTKRALDFYWHAAQEGLSLGHIKMAYLFLRKKEVKQAQAAFTRAAEQGDSRGHRGLMEILQDQSASFEDIEKARQAYLASDDALAYYECAKDLGGGRQFVNHMTHAWESGLTGPKFAHNNWRAYPNWEQGHKFMNTIDQGYRCAVFGIIFGSMSDLDEAISCFKQTEHQHFADYLTDVKELL